MKGDINLKTTIVINKHLLGIGDWGLGIGDWGLGIGPNPQSPCYRIEIILIIYNN
jgi:hypothetical protein